MHRLWNSKVNVTRYNMKKGIILNLSTNLVVLLLIMLHFYPKAG
jgi:hypothetical protein